ncbi:MAG: hypothetical protein HPY44_08850 [Armatimonadetes bacterium]|nr:hypothetical protein [Armatimonadota bacterium]
MAVRCGNTDYDTAEMVRIMKPPRIGWALCILSLLPCVPLWARETADVSLGPERTRPLTTYKGHETQILHEREARFNLGEHGYAIAYKAGYDPAIPDKAFPLEGYIGMPYPTSCNWYHSGFLFVRINGDDVGNVPLSSMTVSEAGPRAIVDLVWHHPAADVRVRFLGEPDADHLKCEIAIDPLTQITSVSVETRCYPSFFTAHHKREGARRIQTPTLLVRENEPRSGPAAENWWSVYYDEVFDVAKGEGAGPCAMMFLPEQALEAHFAPGGYGVATRITYPPETRSIRLAFWEFPNFPNAQALNDFRAKSDAARDALASADFTPAPLRNLDLPGMRAEVERAVAVPEVAKSLGQKIDTIRSWLASQPIAAADNPGAMGVRAQESYLASVDSYQQFAWEVKLAELLAGL